VRLTRVALLISLAPLPHLAGQGVAYEGGLSLETGSYIFTTRTTSLTIATGIAYTAGPLTLRAGLPVFVQNSSLLAGSGAGMMPSGGGSGGNVGSGGMGGGMMGDGGATGMAHYGAAAGDPSVQVGWRLVDRARTGVTLSAAAKIPMTDTTAYGTGQWDVGGTLSLTHRPPGKLFFGLDISYWHLGDLPQLDFRDPILGTATVSRLFPRTWAGSLFVAGGSAALRGYQPPVSVGAGMTHFGRRGLVWGVTGAIGLTETAPQLSVGASWRIGL